MLARLLVTLLATSAADPVADGGAPVPPPHAEPLVIAHRGASALLPEHTLAAYARAIADGGDWIEPDLVATRDGVLVARHENGIGDTTDVASHPEFADRRRVQWIDGREVEDWFTEDFTLAELKTLHARERLPVLRGDARDGRYPVPTLEEIIDLVARESVARGRVIGLVPELKHPSHFQALGLALEPRLLSVLRGHSYTRRAPVWVQSFEVGNLRALRAALAPDETHVRLLQLLGPVHMAPPDQAAAGTGLAYGRMMTAAGLRAIATYADGIGPPTRSVIPVGPDGALGAPTTLVADAHAVGLQVLPYTFRPEDPFLPPALRADGPQARNEAGSISEIRAYLEAGIDGFFADDPALGLRAVEAARRPAETRPASGRP